MSSEQVKSYVDRFETALNTGRPDAIDALVAPGFVDHAPWPGQSADLEGFKAGLAEMRRGFPDLRVAVARMVAEGDLLAVQFTLSGTQLGDFMGAPASGKTFNVEAIDIVRLTEGRVSEHWGVLDAAAMAQQLGL